MRSKFTIVAIEAIIFLIQIMEAIYKSIEISFQYFQNDNNSFLFIQLVMFWF